jgi:hypothetical protein
MEVVTQLSVFLENRAGVLADLTADLAAHGIGIRALTIANLVDHAVVRLVVSDPQHALHLLGERGVLAVTTQVLAVPIPDQTGAIADLARRLGRAGVNIEYAYSGPRPGGQAVVYIHVVDLKTARAALRGTPPRPPGQSGPRATKSKRAKPSRAAR